VIRQLTTDDLPTATEVLERAGLAGAIAMLPRYLRWQPRCGWAAMDRGRLIGLVTVLRQGEAGFVGAMAVDEGHRGAGVGRRLLEHAQADARRAGIATMLLEATPMGEPLYRALGYVAEHETVILTKVATHPSPTSRIADADHAAIAELDRAATGLVRETMVGGLLAECGPAATVHVGGELAGVGLIVGERVGPVLARDAGAGRQIIDALAPSCRVATVPVPNQAALDAFTSHGFTELRRLRRMRLGPAVAQRTEWIWALASPGAG
jgi:GNAT superfamily N-acetyltransferase